MSELDPAFESVLRSHEEKITQLVRDETGDQSLTVNFDRSPLLRIEKKKWPEDFRGFGSNVRPKKQR